MTLDKRLATVKDHLQIKALIADGKRQMITNDNKWYQSMD